MSLLKQRPMARPPAAASGVRRVPEPSRVISTSFRLQGGVSKAFQGMKSVRQ